MYHPEKYQHHNRALDNFCKTFNSASVAAGGLLHMRASETENFREDGSIIHKKTGEIILYDFEKRFSYYHSCGQFRFKTFGQFERKIQKPEITLSIQCSSDEKCFIIAWHEDFQKEEIIYIGSKTGSGTTEKTGKRFTKDFLELNYSQMDLFYKVLLKAYDYGFNKQSFEV